MNRRLKQILIGATIVAFTACGGGDESSSSNNSDSNLNNSNNSSNTTRLKKMTTYKTAEKKELLYVATYEYDNQQRLIRSITKDSNITHIFNLIYQNTLLVKLEYYQSRNGGEKSLAIYQTFLYDDNNRLKEVSDYRNNNFLSAKKEDYRLTFKRYEPKWNDDNHATQWTNTTYSPTGEISSTWVNTVIFNGYQKVRHTINTFVENRLISTAIVDYEYDNKKIIDDGTPCNSQELYTPGELPNANCYKHNIIQMSGLNTNYNLDGPINYENTYTYTYDYTYNNDLPSNMTQSYTKNSILSENPENPQNIYIEYEYFEN